MTKIILKKSRDVTILFRDVCWIMTIGLMFRALSLIPVRMLLLPLPGAFNDVLKGR